MQDVKPTLRVSRGARFRLSPRGQATAAAYQRGLLAVRRRGRAAFERAQQDWADSHGLEIDDGVYLCELAMGQLSLAQLGEALAVCGQARGDVVAAIRRLLERGFIESHPKGEGAGSESSRDRAERELTVAGAELDEQRVGTQPASHGDRRFMDADLREAVYRYFAARRFLDSLD